jgi:YVTN family beta-propeller protein
VAGQLVKFDVAERKVLKSKRMRGDIKLAKPKGIRLSRDGSVLYVSTGRGNAVAVVDPDTLDLKATIPVGSRVWGLAQSADGSRLYATNGLDNTLSVIDTATNKQIQTVEVGDMPWGVVLDE